MAYSGANPNKTVFLENLGAELREFREKAGYNCEFVASVLNPETASRDRISKVERGASGIDLFDYLRLLWFFRDVAGPDHPGVQLARKLLPHATLTAA